VPTFNNPAADAAEAQQALRGVAHGTSSIDDPGQIYDALGSLSAAASSLGQSLHQLADFHDGPTHNSARGFGDSRVGRAAAYQVSWELHRAGEMLKHVAESIDRAHEAEATIAYDVPAPLAPPRPSPPASDLGQGL